MLLELDDALLFFDLAGTLVPIDGSLAPEHGAALARAARRARRIVLVTGQPFHDPQVQGMLGFLAAEAGPHAVAYLTRGGTRWILHGDRFVMDEAYAKQTALGDDLARRIIEVIGVTLASERRTPLIPVTTLDSVAVRVNLSPGERAQVLPVLARAMAALGEELDVVAEGRTSLFVMRPGVNKRRAVRHELELARRDGWAAAAYYFGDQITSGNDRDVVGLAGLALLSLESQIPEPPDGSCRCIGGAPDDVARCLEASSRGGATPASRALPVLCVSLGGTKIEIGALTRWGSFLRSQQFFWRDEADFRDLGADADGAGFCGALAERMMRFLAQRGYGIDDVEVIGIPFPGPGGPQQGWFSNNLSPGFVRGVRLEERLAARLAVSGRPPTIRIALDVKCAAGGELHHPRGRLRGLERGVVLNIATGVAVGFVREARVLVTDSDFAAETDGRYDKDAGQVGRHVVFDTVTGNWRYDYVPRGQTPELAATAIRMTDRLSGPALALRLLRHLEREGLLAACPCDIHRTMTATRGLREVEAVVQVRQSPTPVAGAILTWADTVYAHAGSDALASCLERFAAEVATDLAAALCAFLDAPGWRGLDDPIVLVGGVGERLFASADGQPGRSLGDLLTGALDRLGRSPTIVRSAIAAPTSQSGHAAERESLLFAHQSW